MGLGQDGVRRRFGLARRLGKIGLPGYRESGGSGCDDVCDWRKLVFLLIWLILQEEE